MTKAKLKDATKDLLTGAESVMESVTSVRRGADELMQTLRRYENQFAREDELRRTEEKQAELQRLAQQHTKAYTMPDTEEEAHAPAEVKAVSSAPAPAKAVAALAEAQEVAQAPKPTHAKVTKPAEEVAPIVAEEKPAAHTPKAVQPPVTEAEAEETAPTPAQRPAMAPAYTAPRPAAPSAAGAPYPAYGRPANPQGPFGRPANPQGSFGRPANPQPQPQPQVAFARPVNPPQPGAFARPANPLQQVPFARPANPPQPGAFARPANPQGPYGRPANPQSSFGRPANPQQSPFGRPASPQGTFGRPAGMAPGGRPAPGGFGRPAGPGGRPVGGPSRGGAKGPELTPAVEKERVSNYDPNKKSYIRQHDPERVARNRKQLARDAFNNIDDDVVRGGRRRSKKPSAQMLMAPIKIEKAYMTAETITVKDLTERIGKPAGDILKKLMLLGVMANINNELDFDTASLVCAEFGVMLEMNLAKTAEDTLTETDVEDAEDDLEIRPPVITIMGHVDHGKTSLLDYIRHTRVTAGEAGGITQHIGAYTVDIEGRSITFLDTPGHEAFTAMRARGTQATDIAVLVVAADDGIMPQTIESINHAKASNVPIIIAINKMDKANADPERIKQDLTSYNLVPEEWGGDTIIAPVSATTGSGVDNLLEMILLQADVMQLRANPNRMAKGVIIEAKLDKARGPLATVLVQNGTLHVGDNIVVGLASGRVRAMVNDKGERVDFAGPSTPVEVAGFSEVPSAGEDIMAVSDDHLGRQVVEERLTKIKVERNANSGSKVTLDNLFSQIDQGKVETLNLIIKADVQGSVEAVKQALEKLSNERVKIRVLHSGVGAVTKDDVNLASAFNAIIIGFNIRPDSKASETAVHEGVDIRLYRIIYQAIEDVQKAMKGMLAPEFKENLLGHAEVRNVFQITGSGTVAGCYVTDGKLQRNAQVRLLRDNVVVFEGKLSSLKRFKDDAKEVAQSFECGASLEGFNNIKEGDIIECFVMEEIER